jgi:hypothetical protein
MGWRPSALRRVVAAVGGLVEWVKPSEGRNNEAEAR